MLPVIEIRNRDLERIGVLDFNTVTLKAYFRFNGVGAFEIKLPSDHPHAQDLTQPGAGIIIHYNNQVISGRVQQPEETVSATSLKGDLTVTGVTDEILLAARLTYPNPAKALEEQDTAYYTDNGPYETVAKNLVKNNLGQTALAERKALTVADSLGRGENVVLSTRFKTVLNELQSLAIIGGLGFKVVQVDDDLIFDTYIPADRSREIQLDVENGGLKSSRRAFSAPSATVVAVAGQGEGADRTIKAVSTPESEAAASEWGISFEVFKDQRDTDEQDKLQQSGLEILAENGGTVSAISVEPSSVPGLKPGEDFWLGDIITVVTKSGYASTQITEITLLVADSGLNELITVGDPSVGDYESAQSKRLSGVESRVSALETSEPLIEGLSRLVFETKSELDTYIGVAEQICAVTNDPNPNNNGDYVWRGSWVAAINFVQRHSVSGSQSIPNNTQTQVVLLGTPIVKGNTLIPQLTNSAIGVTVAGRYRVSASVYWNTVNTVGVRELNLVRFDSSNTKVEEYVTANAGSATGLTQYAEQFFEADVGDYFAVVVLQNSGSAQNLNSGSTRAPAFLRVESI